MSDIEDDDYHAPLSPSSADRWIACPGSIRAQAEAPKPEDDTNEHSRLGTAVHALIEVSFILGRDPSSFIGAQLVDARHPRVDEDQCEWANVALEYVYEYIDIHGAENLIVWSERRLYIGGELKITGNVVKDNAVCNGTADFTIAHRDMSMCATIDYKNGKNKVHAKENSQTMLYGVGARSEFGRFKNHKSVIIQPRAGKRSPVDEWQYSAGRMDKFVHLAATSARAALRPDAPRVAGPQCSWCRAAPRCRTYKDKTWAAARVEFSDLDEEPDPARLTNEEVSQVLEAAPVVRKYLDAVESYAQRSLYTDPSSVPGWKLGWGRRERKWDDPVAVAKFCEKIGLTEDAYAPRTLLSPADLSTLVKRHKKANDAVPRRRKRGAAPEPNPLDAFIRYSVPAIKVVPSTGDLEDMGDEDQI